MLKMSCNKHHLQEVSQWKRRGKDANNRHRGEQATRGEERDMDASEDLMIGMWSHERNTFCTPPPAGISQVMFNNHALSSGKNTATSLLLGTDSTVLVHYDEM